MAKGEVRVLSLNANESIDEFKIERFRGKGLSRSALIYEAKQSIAVKLYVDSINAAKDNLSYAKFKNEAKLLKKMDGAPNVLKPVTDFREYALHEKTKKLAPYYAMELMDGSLSTIVFDEDLTFHEKIKISSQIIQGTLDCHKQKICHRDIYTPNILYKRVNGEIICKIADMGSAKLHGAPQPFPYFHPTGLTEYTSPEAAVGLLGGDGAELETMIAADIFSVGLLIYEVLTGLRQERLNAALASMVLLARANGLWDPAVTIKERKVFLKNTVLPQLSSISINPITSSDILESEETAKGLDDLISSMITLDYDKRLKDLALINEKLSALLPQEGN